MEEVNDGLKIYSEEVRNVLSDPPKAILKWGNTILLGFIILLFLLSWIIKYPDILSTQISITTNIPPEKIVAKLSGRIEAILVKDRILIAKNTPLAVIENSANYKDIFLLKSIVDSIDIDKNEFPFYKLKSAQLGEIESSFAAFQKESSANDLNSKLLPYQVEGTA